jgi:hypothetical protein
MNSLPSVSATSARTERITMPAGMAARVMTGRMMYCTWSSVQLPEPSGPAPMAGNQFRRAEKIATSTMPSQ